MNTTKSKTLMAGTMQIALGVSICLSSWSAMATDEYTTELYETYCQACHVSAGAGAPVAFNERDWNKKLDDGLNALVNSAINGVGNMPAQGSCMECTYEDFEDLINYMSKAKPQSDPAE